jgi:hypothetical protein
VRSVGWVVFAWHLDYLLQYQLVLWTECNSRQSVYTTRVLSLVCRVGRRLKLAWLVAKKKQAKLAAVEAWHKHCYV